MKWFFLCDCTANYFKTFKEYRLFSEELLSFLGYITTEYSFRSKELDISKHYQYTKNRKLKFDEIKMEDVWTSYFYSWPKEDTSAYGIKCEFAFQYHKGYNFLTLTYSDENGCPDILELKDELLKRISEHFDISYFCADKIDDAKQPEWFVMGTCNEYLRSSLENRVAFSIQLSKLKNHKLPFLFLYNLTSEAITPKENLIKIGDREYGEFFFPELKNEEFDDYFKNQKWSDKFEELSDKGAVMLSNG